MLQNNAELLNALRQMQNDSNATVADVIKKLEQSLPPASPAYVAPPQEKNKADIAIERQQAKLAVKQSSPCAPAPPQTNATRAALLCRQAGTAALAGFLTELLDRIAALENVNVAQATRISELELQEASRAAKRKTA
jgi:hypothetical protein